MLFLSDFIKGCIVGVANIIPGVSGGTLALTLGIYHKMLSSISNLFHDFKNSIRKLFPILFGCVIGICVFSFVIPWLIENYPFPTVLSFIGLILGGIPMLYRKLKAAKAKQSFGNILGTALFIFFFVGSIFLACLKASENGQGLTATPATMIILFFVGIITSATMIIPGVSGSLVLMILGYYFGIVSAVKDFLNALKALDIETMLSLCKILVPFGIGVLLGIFYIAKLIEWLMKRYPVPTYLSILGLIFASPITIFLKISWTTESFLLGPVAIGVVLLGVFFYLSLWFSAKE